LLLLGWTIFFLVLLASAGLGGRVLRRNGGPVLYWVVGWGSAGLGGVLTLAGAELPTVRCLAHFFGALFVGLLLGGVLVYAERRVPRWLLPASLAWGAARAAVAAAGHENAAWGMALAVEPWATFVAAGIAWRSVPAARSTRAERWLGPVLALLSAIGALHVGWLALGAPEAALIPLWVVAVPPVLGLQVQAGADRLRRRMRRVLDALVAERTVALVASEERYRAVSALSADLSFRVRIDPELRLAAEWTAGPIAAITGRGADIMEGHGWLALVPEAARARLREQLAVLPPGQRFDLERRILGPQGEERWIAVRGISPGRTADGSLVLMGSASDVTERRRAAQEQRRLEGHLQQIQRLESLGVLAGGIAHDFNNLLTVIRGHVRLALAELPAAAPLRARLERIDEAAGHAAGLTGQMLTYAGKAAPALGPLDVGGVVDSLGELLRASLPEGAALAIACEPALPAVEGDAGQLGQVVLNLGLNAADALGERSGQVAIRVAAEAVDAAALRDALGHAGLAPGRYVVLEVRDDGCGMDAQTVARVCEPFFTTKFSGRGLGMAAVLGIVRAHHGALAIESEPGRGTTVRVLLPASGRAVAAPAPAPAPAKLPPARGARVLVVDDDAAVRELAAEMLARAGFEVACAAGGTQAAALVEGGARVDAVLLDLAMPDLGGEATFLRLRAQRPGLPVVLVSGYDEEQASQRFAARGLDAFLRKPFEPEQLVAAVHAALAQRAGREAGA